MNTAKSSLFSRVRPGPTGRQSRLPGFRLSLGITVFYIGLIVLLPLTAMVLKTTGMTWPAFLEAATTPRAMAAYKLTFGASLLAALVNTVFGFLSAWVLTRYRFPGKNLVDALVDFPFALPTAVAGITLTALWVPEGWLGCIAEPHGLTVAYTSYGVFVALVFVGLPFTVRTVQPVLQSLERELEEAAVSLGARPAAIFWRILLPPLVPSLLTGFALAFSRALGEYGSVVFISGNMPLQTEIVPLLIMTRLENYDYEGATALGSTMLVVSFLILLNLNLLQRWQFKLTGGEAGS